MAKYRTQRSYRSGKALSAKVPTSFKDHNLAAMNPLSNQFEPTESNPIRQHAQMAGDPSGGGIAKKVIDYFTDKGKTVKTPPKEEKKSEGGYKTIKEKQLDSKNLEGNVD